MRSHLRALGPPPRMRDTRDISSMRDTRSLPASLSTKRVWYASAGTSRGVAPPTSRGVAPPFAHLHVHSNYSLREGAARVEDLAQSAGEMGMEALALTDHDGMYGAVRFTLACLDAGIRPILGAELEWGEGYHAVLLARNKKGWSNLCRLVTEMHLDERAHGIDTRSLPSGPRRVSALQPGKRPRTSFESIAERSEGLYALSGCERGEVGWFASLGRTEEAETAARKWLDVFGTECFAIEISNHLAQEDTLRNQNLIDLAGSLGIQTAATNNVHYVGRDDAVIHDVADCIRRIVPLTRTTAPRENAEYWLKSPEKMARLHPAEAIEGAARVAEACNYQFPMGEFHFPDLYSERGESSTSILARRCWEGLRRRYPVVTKEIDDRLQMELNLIRRTGFCGYFLLVADIVDHAKRVLGIRCACRGSAAGSLVAYALGISDVDPVRHDLVFERFMNEHRREIPDIDVDFESARREDVNAYILETYGERTAMVAMMETFRARAALREVGKTLGLPESEIDLVAKAFPHISAGKIKEAVEGLPEVAHLNLSSSRLETLFDLASRLDGYPRHLAMHPSGVILSDESLKDLMPMQRSFEGFLMSQFDKDDVEALGVAKLDVLGVRMLSTLTHTLDEIERVHGERIDLDKIAKDDGATFELIRDSRTMGCFQIESPGQRELLGKFQPDRFEDLIIDISLFRPGPMKADMIDPFLSRRMEIEPVTYPHRSMAPILKESNGVIVYHEQVMRVISALTGCSLSEADKIRRALGGGLGDEDAMRPLEEPDLVLRREVLAKAAGRGWEPAVAEKVWKEVESFASFGFCKAHAAAFAVPTYQSAWLKAHYPAEFYCGVLTHDPGMYPRRAILSDARAHNVPILSVDVNHSWADYRVDSFTTEAVTVAAIPSGRHGVGQGRGVLRGAFLGPGDSLGTDVRAQLDAPSKSPSPSPNKGGRRLRERGIRLGLQDVKGISKEEIDSIIEGRPWKDLEDFCKRAQVSRPVVEALVHCGALDGIKGRRPRRELLWKIEEIWAARVPRDAGQMSLDLSIAEQVVLPGIADYSDRERVEAELEVLGLDASHHLISFYLQHLEKLGWTRACELRGLRGNSKVVVAGVKVATQTPPTKSGRRVVFLTLDDGTGQSDVALFEEAHSKYLRRVFDGWILAVKGTLRRTGPKGVSILGEEVIDLAEQAPTRKIWHASPGSAGR